MAASAPRAVPAWLWDVALVALVVVAYQPALGNGWIWDDDDYVTANHALRSWHGLWQLWFEPGVVPQYYPVTFTSLWVEWQLWGSWPPPFHATNVLLHAANAVLAWRVLDRLGVPGAWLAAALFAVHPVHVESVAWVTERKNVLSATFYLAAALVFVTRVAGWPPREQRAPYVLVVVLFTLALLSKTVTATLPVALAIALWWRDGRLRRADVRLLLPLLVLGAGAAALTAWMERWRVGAVGPYWDQTFLERCLIAGRALWFYAGKLVWPHPVVFNYERWVLDVGDWRQWVWPIAAVVVATVAWLARDRPGRGFAAGLGFFAVSLAPALGFVNVFPMRYSFVADHFQYLASLGILALVGAAAARIARERAIVATLAVVTVLAVLATLTWRQTHAYADVETLWRDTLAKNPRSVLAAQNLGTIEYGRGRLSDALVLYERALSIEPDDPDVRNSTGLVLARLGRRDEAIAHFEAVLKAEPKHAEAARNMGTVLAALGRRDEALAAYERAVAAAPDMVEAREDLALLLVRAGRAVDAEVQAREAARLAPTSDRAHLTLGAALTAQGKTADALAAFEDATRVAPRSTEASIALAEARAAGGDYERAIGEAERARDLARQQGQATAVAEIERRIAGYRERMPAPPGR